MVTMRRDIAVTKNVSTEATAPMNPYDRFLLKKNSRRNADFAPNGNRESRFDRVEERAELEDTKEAPIGFFSSFFADKKEAKATKYFSQKESVKKEAIATENENNVAMDTEYAYSNYMMQELNRKTKGDRVLSKEEFCQKMLQQTYPSAAAKNEPISVPKMRPEKPKKVVRPGQLTKVGKIILSVYVLLVMLTASTLIAVNVFAEPVVADAEEKIVANGERIIRPMTLEKLEKEEENWFDTLCDTVKK